jgi:uncharacterized membrane protein
MTKIKIRTGLLALNIVVILLILAITFAPATALRVILGLPFLLFFPGYVLITALFPRKSQLGTVERLALSLGFSVAVVALIGLVLNYTPWGVSLYPTLISISIFIVVMSLVAWYRWRHLAEEERFIVSLHLRQPFRKESGIDRRLSIILAVTMLVAVGALVYAIAAPRVGERFTEFYILGPEGTAKDYPRELVVGEEAKIIIGIINQEHETVNYRVVVTVDGTTQNEVSPVVLDHAASWEHEVTFTPGQPGDRQKVEFLLYKNKETEPCLSPIHLWVDVKERG